MLMTIARLPGLRFEMDADVSYRALAGPGADDNSAPMDNGVRLKAEKTDSLTKYYLLGAWRRQDATSAQLTDSGVILAKGDISTYVLDAGFMRQVTRTDSISWSVRGMSVDLTSPTPSASSYLDLTTTGAWTRRLNSTTDVYTSLQLEWLARDDLANTQTIFARAMTGLSSHFSKQLTFKGAVGVGVHRTDQDAALSPSAKQPSEESAGWLADAQVHLPPRPGHRSLAFSCAADGAERGGRDPELARRSARGSATPSITRRTWCWQANSIVRCRWTASPMTTRITCERR